MSTAEPHLELIGSIYEAALDPRCWGEVLRKIGGALNASAATLICESPCAGLHGVLASYGVSDETVGLYGRHYMNEDYTLKAGLARPEGTWISNGKLFPDAEDRRTEFCCDFLKPAGLGHIAGTILYRSQGAFAALGLHRPHDKLRFGREDEQLYRLFEPHIGRAIAIFHRLSLADVRANALSELLDQLTVGVLLLDSRAEIVRANSEAVRTAKDDDGFSFSRSSLSTSRPDLTRSLRSLVLAACSSKGSGTPAGGEMLLERPSGLRPYEVLVAPLARGQVEVGRRSAEAVLFVRDPERQVTPPEAVLQRLYGLTPAEALLTNQLLKGRNVAQAAEGLRISLNTARTHLKRVFAKTETSRQSELVRLLCQGPLTLFSPRSREDHPNG